MGTDFKNISVENTSSYSFTQSTKINLPNSNTFTTKYINENTTFNDKPFYLKNKTTLAYQNVSLGSDNSYNTSPVKTISTVTNTFNKTITLPSTNYEINHNNNLTTTTTSDSNYLETAF